MVSHTTRLTETRVIRLRSGIEFSLPGAMMKLDVVQKVITNPHFVKLAVQAASCMRDDLINILTQIEQIYYCEYVKCFDASTLRSTIRDVADAAFKYADSVKDLYYFCNQSNISEIKENLSKGNSKPLCQFVQRKSFYIEETISHHSFFCASLDAVRVALSTAAEDVVKNQSKAKLKKNATRAVGGSTTAAVLVGGATVSFVAGYFTFGIGTAIGLPLTAAVGATTGIVTHFVANDFHKAEKALRNHAGKFASLKDIAEKINEPIIVLNRQVVTFDRRHRSLQHMEQHHDYHSCCSTLDSLYELSSTQYPTITQLLDDIQLIKDRISATEV